MKTEGLLLVDTVAYRETEQKRLSKYNEMSGKHNTSTKVYTCFICEIDQFFYLCAVRTQYIVSIRGSDDGVVLECIMDFKLYILRLS